MKSIAIILAITSAKAMFPVQCGDREIVSQNGQYCFICPTHTRAQNNNTRCAPDMCKRNQILTKMGNCDTCPEGQVAGPMGRSCEDDPNATKEEPKPEPKAEPKPEPEPVKEPEAAPKPTPEPTPEPTPAPAPKAAPVVAVVEIVEEECSGNQIKVGNRCSECPRNYKPSPDGNSCVTVDLRCQWWERVSDDGTSCQICPPFTRSQNNGSSCGADQCDNGIVEYYGTCMRCQPGTQPDENQRQCIRIPNRTNLKSASTELLTKSEVPADVTVKEEKPEDASGEFKEATPAKDKVSITEDPAMFNTIVIAALAFFVFVLAMFIAIAFLRIRGNSKSTFEPEMEADPEKTERMSIRKCEIPSPRGVEDVPAQNEGGAINTHQMPFDVAGQSPDKQLQISQYVSNDQLVDEESKEQALKVPSPDKALEFRSPQKVDQEQ